MTSSGLTVGPAVPSLTRWGLSSDADLTYRTLACFGPRAPRELASELGLARRRLDTALAELRSAGVAAPFEDGRSNGRPGAAWVAGSPAKVITALRSRRLRLADQLLQARRHHEVVRSLNDRLAQVGIPTAPGMGGSITDGVRYLSSRALLRRRLAELVPRERQEHLAINTEQVFEAESTRASSPLERFFAERRVNVRVLGLPPADGDAVDPSAHLLASTSFQYRETFDTPLKLFVCDRRVALFPLDPMDFERGYFEVSHPGIVASLVGLFDQHWTTATDPQLHGVPGIVLSHRERDLIALLAHGHTDITAAQELRISARSVTNRMRALMDRLGVENRFQLGLVLGASRAAAPPSLDPAIAPAASVASLRKAS